MSAEISLQFLQHSGAFCVENPLRRIRIHRVAVRECFEFKEGIWVWSSF